MDYRKTKLYKKLTSYLACAIAEGFCEGEGASEENQLTAWQWLVDSGQVWGFQGWFGRTANDLLEQGIIDKPGKAQKDYWGNTIPSTIK